MTPKERALALTPKERELAIQVLDTKVGTDHNILTSHMRLIVLECIEEFRRLQGLEKGASHDN